MWAGVAQVARGWNDRRLVSLVGNTRRLLAYKAGEEIRTLNIQLGRLDGVSSNLLSNNEVIESENTAVPHSVSQNPQTTPKQPNLATGSTSVSSSPTPPISSTDTTRLTVIVELLADLSEPQRRAIIQTLPLADRIIAAQLLAEQNGS